MAKLLVICGPTATGKTSLGIGLAKKFNGEIISADSRQVYRNLDIGTGKDLPEGVKIKYPWFGKYGYYEIEGVKIWGYDLADPRHEFNISLYIKFADRIVKDIDTRGKLPILIGGTGLYIKGVTEGIPTAKVPRSDKFRKNLEKLTPPELYEMLARMDSLRAAQMNSSDKKNPRRLVRAIEVATWKMNNINEDKKIDKKKNNFKILQIGLTAPKETIDKKIEARVEERIRKGIKIEVQLLLKKGIAWDTQAMSSMGYGVWRDFFEGRRPEDQVQKSWKIEEKKYAKRQMTWFTKDKGIKWFDITKGTFPKEVEKMVEKWHNSANAKKN